MSHLRTSQNLRSTRTRLKGIPKWLFGQVVFWRPRVPRPKNHTCSGKSCLFGIAAFGGKAKKQLVSGKCVVPWPRHPRPPKKQLTNKPLRDSVDLQMNVRPKFMVLLRAARLRDGTKNNRPKNAAPDHQIRSSGPRKSVAEEEHLGTLKVSKTN